MSNRRFHPSRKRVDDYYGVHETGMGSVPAPPPNPPAPPARPPESSQPDTGRVFLVPPNTAHGGAPEVVEGDDAVTPPEPAPSRPDPLNDPLTSETFSGVQPEPDTYEPGLAASFGFSTTAYSRSDPEPDNEFRDPFAPPRFEPRVADSNPVGDVFVPQDAPVDHPENYLDVEIVDVTHEPPRLRERLALDAFPYTQIDESYVDPETLPTAKEPGGMTDFNESLREAMAIDGALGVALVDGQSGMALATAGSPAQFNLEVAAAGNSALVQAMGRTITDLELDDHLEDILITLGSQYQIVRPIKRSTDGLFLYLVLDRARANLAMARFRLTKLEESIEV